jgi:hypothetical protein
MQNSLFRDGLELGSQRYVVVDYVGRFEMAVIWVDDDTGLLHD